MIYSYKIHVINRDLNLDASYKNVVQVFNPTTKTKDYSSVFTSDELTFNDADVEINFDIGDGVNSSVVLDLEDAENEDTHVSKQFGVNSSSISASAALNRQYCIVQEVTKNDNLDIVSTKLYFYFIIGQNIRNGNIIKYNLQLDAFMTYPLYSDIDVNKTRISRAHVNRFENLSTLASANFNLSNKYLETGEPTDDKYSKVTKNVINVKFNPVTEIKAAPTSTITDVSEDLILSILNKTMWLYVEKRETNPDANYMFFAPYLPNEPVIVHNYMLNSVSIGCCCYNDITNVDTTKIFVDAMSWYPAHAEDVDIINAFISPFAPYSYIEDKTQLNILYDCSITEGNRYLKIYFNLVNLQMPTNTGRILYYADLAKQKINEIDYNLNNQRYGYEPTATFYHQSPTITLFDKNNFLSNTPFSASMIEKAEIKTKIRQTYNEFNLKTILDDNETKIDLNYLKTNNVQIQAFCDMNLISNGTIFLTLNNLYDKKKGAYLMPKYTPQFYSDKFKEFVANNKNYKITGIGLPLAKQTISGFTMGASKETSASDLINWYTNLGSNVIAYFANKDNMINSPDAVKYKGESHKLDLFVNRYPVFIENNTLREEEKKAVDFYFYEYGYTINEIEEIKNFLTRSSFNYIQTENCEKDLHALINKNVLDVIIKALNNGVRFWTPTHYAANKFEYTTNNLESALLA